MGGESHPTGRVPHLDLVYRADVQGRRMGIFLLISSAFRRITPADAWIASAVLRDTEGHRRSALALARVCACTRWRCFPPCSSPRGMSRGEDPMPCKIGVDRKRRTSTSSFRSWRHCDACVGAEIDSANGKCDDDDDATGGEATPTSRSMPPNPPSVPQHSQITISKRSSVCSSRLLEKR
jgi:hypothetical protein